MIIYTNLATKRQRIVAPRHAFTLIELLVVIAIIAILAAILFPVFATARERARSTSCLSNSKQLATAIHMYTQDYDEYLPMYVLLNAASTKAEKGWQVSLMPYVKSTQAFVCPSASKPSTCTVYACDPTFVSDTLLGSGSYGFNYIYLGNYALINGVRQGTPFNLAAIDKSAETICLTEISSYVGTSATYPPSLWGTAYTVYGGQTYGDQFATRHLEGNNVVFTDGHAKWLKKSMVRDYNGNGKDDNGWWCLDKKIGAASCPGA